MFFVSSSTLNLSSGRIPTTHIILFSDKLVFPLKLRPWEDGDYFFPFGMKGKKKLSKFFKDEKLSLISKEKIWVLLSENNIIWVVGMRSDARFKVDDETKHILKITYSEK